MRWALTWLGLGFVIKWLKERGEAMFDVLLVLLSFALIFVVFGTLHLTIWQALLVFLFWSFVVLMVKVE